MTYIRKAGFVPAATVGPCMRCGETGTLGDRLCTRCWDRRVDEADAWTASRHGRRTERRADL